MKNLLKSILLGVAWGCTINCIVCLIIALIQGEINFTSAEYLKQFICSAIVGIGFTVPSLVYKSERLPQATKCLMHLGIGFVIYFPTAFFAGWIPTESGILGAVMTVATMLIGSIIVYFFFWMYYKNEAKKMNQKIQEKML